MSEQTPPAAGDFGPGSQIAGYRLDEQIGRGGMAVVFRAYDTRLERRVAIKILAPELARDDAFRQRFIRESRAAAAVDHPNIIPIYEAGEAGGVLFIAMRFVDGRDVHTLIREFGSLSSARTCDIVNQVASALDAAHGHGLVHRDVKPANMLRDATTGSSHSDHVYLSDFGLSKHSLATSGLTSQGQFLGTLNYVAPEQIEGRPVDGRTDEYALACSAFEMLTGTPPFRRDETLAIMYAQLSTAPPLLTSARPDLPTAANDVVTRALAKSPDDRYGTCLEFAAALRQACGLGPGHTEPGAVPPPGRGTTRVVHSAELASAGRADEAQVPAGMSPGAQAPAGMTPAGMMPTGQMAADQMPTGGTPQPHMAAAAGPPTQAARVPGSGPTAEHVTDPLREFGFVMPQKPPRRKGRILAIALAVCVLLAGGGAYLLLGGKSQAKGTHSAVALALPACTSKTASAPALRSVPTHMAPVGGQPFDVAVTANGFGFVSLSKSGLAVLDTTRAAPRLIRTVPVPGSAQGMAITHSQKYLLVASGPGLTVFQVASLEQGLTSPLGTLVSPGAHHPVEVAVSKDDSFAFVSIQNSNRVAVFNLKRALTAGFSAADLVGDIPTGGKDPVGIAVSPDGRHLYVASGIENQASKSAGGALSVVDVRKAETHPGSSAVVSVVHNLCGPARVITSADGRDVWVTAGGANALLGFSAAKLISDPKHALTARVALGQIPLGLAMTQNGTRIVVADSNRDKVGGSAADLAVIDVSKALANKPALIGLVKSGPQPRQFALEPNGKILLVTDTATGQVETVNIARLP